MKKYIIPILLGAATLFATSCADKLDIPQKGVTPYEDFYNGSDESAEGALVSMYATFGSNIARPNGEVIIAPYIALFNLPGDDVYAAGEFFGDNDFNGQINEFRFDANAQLVTSMYIGFYQIIYGANLVITNFGDVADTPTKKRCVAEARVMRAFCHMMLAIGWDVPPLIDHVLEGADKPYNCDKDPDNPMSHNELLEWCAKECLESVADLRERTSPTDKAGCCYITKAFANFVAGKALIFAGKYAEAKAPLKAIITSGKYSLVPGERMRETFHLVGEHNEEVIFTSNLNVSSSTDLNKSIWMHQDIWGWRMDHCAGQPSSVKGGWGGLGVREDFAEALIANDGFDSFRRRAWIKKFDPEILYEMDYGTDEGKTLEEKKKADDSGIKSYLYGQSEYLMYKRVCDNADMDTWFSTIGVLIAHYPEALLLYAEACAQTGDNDGLQYLNLIQDRAGSKHRSTSLTLAEVQNEKRFELFLEGCRWADQVRWGQTESLADNGKRVPQLYDAYWSKGEAEHRIYVEDQHPNGSAQVGFVKGKHEHFPFPGSRVIAINPNMVQNPGY